MKKSIKPFSHNELFLRLIEKDDLEYTLSWRNRDEYRCWFNTTNIISPEEHFNWFNEYLKREDDFIFLVTNEIGIRYGQLSIYDINWRDKEAIFGRLLVNPEFAGNGLMKRATLAALKLAKQVLEIQKLKLEVKQNNDRAIYIYEAYGFLPHSINNNGLLIMSVEL